MTWFDEIGNLLKQYTGGATTAPAGEINAHFDQVMKAAPSNVIADGLAAAFRSEQTPEVGQMLSTLFTNSNADQKAGLLNQLISSVSPGVLTQVLSGAGLAGLVGKAGAQLTPDQVKTISPQVVEQLATQAEKANPSIIDTLSRFYAEHGTLVKTLGGAALTVLLAKVAESQRKVA